MCRSISSDDNDTRAGEHTDATDLALRSSEHQDPAENSPNASRRGDRGRTLRSPLSRAAWITGQVSAALLLVALNNSQSRHWTWTNALETYNSLSGDQGAIRMCHEPKDVKIFTSEASESGSVRLTVGSPIAPVPLGPLMWCRTFSAD